MSTKERISLVLWAILALSLCGCTVNLQGGKTNTIINNKKQKTFKAEYPEGRSLQQFVADKVNGVKYD